MDSQKHALRPGENDLGVLVTRTAGVTLGRVVNSEGSPIEGA